MLARIAPCLLVLVLACGGAKMGRPTQIAAVGAPVTTTTTADPDGLRVLANGRAGEGDRGLIATSPRALRELWNDVGLDGEPPAVDFATHVVLGTNFEGGVCQPEIIAAHVDAARTLTLEYARDRGACILLAVRVARVIAVPRGLVGTRFTWQVRGGEAYAFELPSGTAATPARAAAAPRRPAGTRPRGIVDLPPEGTLALRALDDGRAVWVVHRRGGELTVVLADLATRQPHVRTPVAWDARTGRFTTGHDSHGRSVHGGAALTALAFERRGSQLAIGQPVPVVPGAIEARTQAPRLDGTAKPYGAAPVELGRLADGQLAVVEADLVTGLDGIPRLCRIPEGKLRGYLAGCPAGAPRLLDAARGPRKGIDQQMGPFVVRRRGAGVDLGIGLGGGAAGWAVERSLQPAAAPGATRPRGTLALGTPAAGDTDGALDGFMPPCIPREAHGGPDESWELVAPVAGTYVVELAGTADGVLAVVGDRGQVLACNDDRHGHYRSSVVAVTLAQGAKVRVIVDAFSGFRQRYTLRAEHLALDAGGVLALGREVRGDTSSAIDQHSRGCHAPAGDHGYRFEVRQAGSYRFTLATTGWTGVVSVIDGNGEQRGCSVSPSSTYRLEPGTYTIVVDGNSEQAHGPYTLRVDRE